MTSSPSASTRACIPIRDTTPGAIHRGGDSRVAAEYDLREARSGETLSEPHQSVEGKKIAFRLARQRGRPPPDRGEVPAGDSKLDITPIHFRGAAWRSPPCSRRAADRLHGYLRTRCPQVAGSSAPLAVVQRERIPARPDVPTFAEAGFPGVGGLHLGGRVPPAAHNRPPMQKLNEAVNAAIRKPRGARAACITQRLTTAGPTGSKR